MTYLTRNMRREGAAEDSSSTAAWNAKIRGSKKWVLFPPEVVPPGVHPNPGGTEVAFCVSLVEWFMNFGAVFFGGRVASSPIKAGDEAILRLLIKRNINVNEINADRNIYMKASFRLYRQQDRILSTFHSICDDDVEEMDVARAESSTCKKKPIRVLFSICKGVLLTPKQISGVISEENLKLIINSKPDSNVEIIEALDGRYARWTKHQEIPDSLKGVNWFEEYGKVRDQGCHGTCWAFASTELVSAYRKIRGYDPMYIEYSPQELVDFACRGKVSTKRPGHFCYPLSTIKGLNYIKENGVQREDHREYVGCKTQVSPQKKSLPTVRIKDVKELTTYEEVFEKLRSGPLGATVAMFKPDFPNVRSGIYRGPIDAKSTWTGFHAVQIVGVGKEDDESYFWVRASNGTKIGINGYLKVSMDVRLLHIPTKGGEARKSKHFGEPMPLIRRFCYPELD